jgi:competence protein ComEC
MSAPQDTGLRMASAALAWLAGIGLQMQQPLLWPLASYVVLCGVGLVALLLARQLGRGAGRRGSTHGGSAQSRASALEPIIRGSARAGGAATTLCLLLGLLGLAFGSTGWRATTRLAQMLPAALEGRDLQLTGAVVRMPQPGPQGTRFVFDVEGAALDGSTVAVPRRVALGWYRGLDGEALIGAAPPDLRAGQRWQLTARLGQPHGTLNPHGFDLELWLFEQDIGASGTVRTGTGAATRLLAEGVGAPVERARQTVRDAILMRVHDVQAAGVLAALTVGDQAAIERDDWELFRDTGVAHLMSISGLHVTMFAWLAALALGALWRRSARLMLCCPAPTAARWGGVLAAGAYALLAGWGVPAQRTLWMLAAVALLRSIGVRWPPSLVLLVAAVVVTVLDPWAVMQPGFWLSFVAVGLLMVSEPLAPRGAPPPLRRDHRLWAAMRAGLRTQAVASIGLAPLSLVFFQQVSLIGFVANLMAIPLVTLVLTPLALLGVLLPPLWAAAALLVQGLVAWLAWLVHWPFGVWDAAAAPAWAVVSGLLGGWLLVGPLPWRLRLLGLPLLLPLAAPPQHPPADGAFEAVVADIGQGTAVLVRTQAHLLLYDAGPRYSAEADAAQRVLLPLLHGRGEGAVDLLLLSHSDSDHVGGAASLLAQRQVRAMLSSLPAAHPLLGRGPPHRRCQAGQSWQWDGVRFDVLHPLADDAVPGTKPNALSCVLRVQARDGRSLLLTGDIEAAQEAALVARLGAGLRSQVLLVPHHGSRTSSTEAFVLAVAPGTALVQAAYRSRFGHPAPDVVARYQALGVELLRSDECGAWTWDGQGSTRCERDAARRYWHHRPVHGLPPAR